MGIVLDDGVSLNTLIGLPNVCIWKIVLDVTKNCAISVVFNILFPIVFQTVYSVLPKGTDFKDSYFCKPRNNNPGTALIFLQVYSNCVM